MISRWQISTGELSAWLPPSLYAAAVLLSTWVLFDARRRGLPFHIVAAWTLATLISPHIVLPVYLITRIFTRKPDAAEPLEESTSHEETKADDSPAHTPIADDADEEVAAQTTADTRAPSKRKLALPLFYAFALLAAGALYFHRDYHSFDAHLARAANARLLERRSVAIREYRAALRLSDDAHTHKLLAFQLAEAGQTEAALAELRAAERGGEPDALIPYLSARLLDALGRRAEADLEYQKFTQSSFCIAPPNAPPDTRCAEASARAQQRQGTLSQ